MRFLGHVMSRNEMEWWKDEKREGEKEKKKYMNGVMRATGRHHNPAELLQLTRNTVRWRSMVAEVQVDVARR